MKIKHQRKQSLRWMAARLRRLKVTQAPSDRQKARIKQLNSAITILEGARP
jgi:hypothetical protein